jgi:hypothetical protein
MFNRRDFMRTGAMLGGASLLTRESAMAATPDNEFRAFQVSRRKLLWSLLGDLPEKTPPKATVKKVEQHDGFALEYLDLELNGLETVPALLLIPDKRAEKAPGMVYNHWHGGNYDAGKTELLNGTRAMKAYAPVYAEKGIVALAIDAWCFGERMPYPDKGGQGESDTFKEMLWKGRVLWGMMVFDSWQALNYLSTRPEVDASRIGTFGISMGSTMAWWLAALDERIQCCIDLCCLTDYEALIETQGLRRHGIYYYVPSLMRHFQTHQINELIVPRSHLSLNGRHDGLTPPAGVERIRDHLLPLYEKYGKAEDCHIGLYDCRHEELPEMRELILAWLDRKL